MVATATYPLPPDEGPRRRWRRRQRPWSTQNRTKSLCPLVLVVLGPMLLGVAMAAAAVLTAAESRNIHGILLWLFMGIVLGLVLFLPMAVLEAFRPTLARRLRPYACHIERYVSLAMALAMGYLLASGRYAAFDVTTMLAGFVVWLGAMTKVGLWILFRPSE